MAADLDTVKELVRAKRFFVADQNSEAYAMGYLAALDWVQHCIEELLDFDGQDAPVGAVQGGHGSLPDASGSGSPKSAQIDSQSGGDHG